MRCRRHHARVPRIFGTDGFRIIELTMTRPSKQTRSYPEKLPLPTCEPVLDSFRLVIALSHSFSFSRFFNIVSMSWICLVIVMRSLILRLTITQWSKHDHKSYRYIVIDIGRITQNIVTLYTLLKKSWKLHFKRLKNNIKFSLFSRNSIYVRKAHTIHKSGTYI